MKRLIFVPVVAVAGAPALAGNYDWEVGAQYERVSADLTDNRFASIGPGPGFPSLDVDTESDTLSLSGTWFFSGLSDDAGPRSRAAFVDRASSLSFSYGDTAVDIDTVFRIPGTPPQIDRQSFEQDGNSYAFALRYVFEPSGWFALGDIGRFESASFIDVEADVFSVGVGKYLGETTTLELVASRADVDVSGTLAGGSDTDDGLALTLRHIGGDATRWQWGTTLSLSNQSIDDADGSYTARFSLYPNRDVSLDIDISGPVGGGGEFGSTVVSIGGGWFVMPALELTAGFLVSDVDEPEGTSADEDGFRIGARYRF